LHRRFGITASTRASLYFYNTRAEVDALVEGLRQTQKFFGAA
jgi:cysteine desulfurase/selenocysteine lyase